MSDLELLKQYALENRQEAFAALLDRHLRLVYSAALRQVRLPQLAEEVAQSVFIDLARAAGKLEPGTILTAWLYQVARRTAIDVVRRESRHQLREQIAFALNNVNASDTNWRAIEPFLDDAMAALDPSDRAAILLRYFEDKSLREIGQVLGTSEDAAQKRVSRALDELREFFSKRGRTVGVGALATVLSANTVQSAPTGLKAAILTHAGISGTAVSVVGALEITKTIAMTTFQKAVIAATLVAAVGTGLYEARRVSTLQEQLQALQQHPAPVTGQDDSSRQLLDAANRQLANLRAENEKLRRAAADLPRLRGEVARLRDTPSAATNNPDIAIAKAWLARVSQLKSRLQQTPSAKIPELQYLTEQDWLNVAKEDLNTDEDYRKAFSGLRGVAENAFISSSLRPALSQYEKANQGQFPTDISQLQSYFNPPVDPSILQRWEVAPKATVPSLGMGDSIITQIAAVDTDYDTRFGIGPNGWGSAGSQDWNPTAADAGTLPQLLKAYAAANNGMMPTDISQLAPYVTTPEQQAEFQAAIKRVPK